MFIVGWVGGDRAEWEARKGEPFLQYWYVAALIVAMNGGIGALYAWKTGTGNVWLVGLLSLLPLVWPFVEYREAPADSKNWGPILLVSFIMVVFLWIAGRVGQKIGTHFGMRVTSRISATQP